jgi:hypothetical protein
MRRGRPGGALLWAGALVVLLVLAACTAAAAAAVTITRRRHRHPAPASSSAARGCDAFAAGRWVVDGSYPLYDSASCPFIRDEFACARFGRPDTMYLKYRWQLDPPCAQPRYVNKELTSSCRSFLSLSFSIGKLASSSSSSRHGEREACSWWKEIGCGCDCDCW